MKSFDDGSSIFLLLYVDDMLISTKSISEVKNLKILLSREFDVKDLGAANTILRMEIHRERALGRLWLSQSGYVRKVLEMFSMEIAKPDMSKVPYASAMGCLMYVMVCIRLDLAQAVSAISKFQSNPERSH